MLGGRRRGRRAVGGDRRRPGGRHDRGLPHRGRRPGRDHAAQPGLRGERARSGRRPTCSGPGFALGTGSAVRLTEVTVGPLPTLPLLAGLPNGPMGAAGARAAGGAGAGRAGRRLAADAAARSTGRRSAGRPGRPAPPWSLVLGGGLLAGPVAGLLLGRARRGSRAARWATAGWPTIGPDPWQVGLVATVVVAVSATIGAAAGRVFGPSPKRLAATPTGAQGDLPGRDRPRSRPR